jgi:5-formyltetrahydrofolate cyclo-ligase
LIATKSQWRSRLVAARLAIPEPEHARRAAALAAGAVKLAARTGGPVCAYLPVGSEPGSPELVEALHAAGHEVLLPVVQREPGPLDWARYAGQHELAAAPLGLREPTGTRLGVRAVATARLVLVPPTGTGAGSAGGAAITTGHSR